MKDQALNLSSNNPEFGRKLRFLWKTLKATKKTEEKKNVDTYKIVPTKVMSINEPLISLISDHQSNCVC